MSIATQLADDMEAQEAFFGTAASMTWSGSSYNGTLSPITKTDNMQVGGFVPDYDAQFYVRTELFTDGIYPNVGDDVTVSSTTYSISSVDVDPDGVILVLDLSNKRR